MIRWSGSQVITRSIAAHQLAANGLDQRGEIAVVPKRVVRDVDTPEMVRHAARTHRVKLRLHRGVCAGRDDAELHAPA